MGGINLSGCRGIAHPGGISKPGANAETNPGYRWVRDKLNRLIPYLGVLYGKQTGR